MSATAFAGFAASQLNFRLLVDAAPDAIVVTKRDGGIVLVNTQMEKLFGYPLQELVGRKVEVLIPQRVRRRFVKNRQLCFSRRSEQITVASLELYGLRKDGTEFPIDIIFTPVEASGEVLVATSIRDITRRKRTEELESHLAAIVEASDDAIIGTDVDGTIISWNKGAEKMCGYKAKEILGQSVSVFVPPNRLGEHSENLKRLRRGEHIQRFETTRIHKDGHPIDVSITISPVKGRGGVVVGASVVARDITEHKEAQSALLDLRALVEASDDAIIGTDVDGTIVSWNKGAEKMCGYKAEEILGRSVSVFVPPDRLGEHSENLKRLRRGQHIQRVETTRIHKDGHPIDVSITISPVKGRGGVVVGASVVARDITEHKEAQNALLGLRALVEASADGIIGKTMDGTIVSWNMGAEKIYGYKAEEMLGHPISELIPPGHRDELPGIMKRLRRGEHIQRFETTRIHKDGHPIDVSLTISPVKDRGGVVVGAAVVARDITEQRQAREALRLSEERFRVALKNAPVVVFSHDLQLRYTWINSPHLTAARENYLGRTDAEVFGAEEGARLTAIKEEALRTGMDSHTEVSLTLKGERRYFDLVVEPLRNSEGKILGLLYSAIDITSLKETIARLQEALNQVQQLSGLLPICASYKKIKDERDRWQPLESYIQSRSEAKFTHGICPDCMRKLYPDYCP